jgi:tryptophan synthase alpha chain
MNKLDNRFKELKREDRGALIVYFPIGEPNIDMLELADNYVNSGVDVLEIGLPVNDPYLDGKTISQSMRRIRESGFKIEHAFEQIREIHRRHPDVGLEIMCYKQIFDLINLSEFSDTCRNSFIDAVLVADANLDDQNYIRGYLGEKIHCLSFLPFQTEQKYLEYLALNSKGFVFLQAQNGKTGARLELEPQLDNKIKWAKELINCTPVCVGFGISTPEQCSQVKAMGADGVIIGSEAVTRLKTLGVRECAAFLRECKNSL